MSGRSEFRATQAALHQGVASGRPGEEVLEPGARGKEAARRAIPGISRPRAGQEVWRPPLGGPTATHLALFQRIFLCSQWTINRESIGNMYDFLGPLKQTQNNHEYVIWAMMIL